jgi:hypothetical protein
MNEQAETGKTDISQATSLEEVAAYWDTHSLADHWEQTEQTEVAVTAKRTYRVVIDPEVFEQVAAQARARGLQPETLVNLWLVQQLKAAA